MVESLLLLKSRIRQWRENLFVQAGLFFLLVLVISIGAMFLIIAFVATLAYSVR